VSEKSSWQFMIAECFDTEGCRFAASQPSSQKISDAMASAKRSGADLSDFNKELLLHIWEWSKAQDPATDPILVYRLMKDALDLAAARWEAERGG
jgi:hypothetical protein